MNHEVRHFRGDLIITGDYSELISPSVLSVFFYYPFVTSVSPDNGTRCPFVGLGCTSSLRPIWTGLRINRAWEETATHQTQLFSKDNVWHIHNTLSSSSSIWPFLFFVWGFGHMVQALAEPPVLLLGESEEDRDVQLCSHESNGTSKWKSGHDVDELHWLIIPVKHSVL